MSKLMSKNDARVIILLNKIEKIAEQLNNMLTVACADVAIERLYALTKALRSNVGIDRMAFNSVKMLVEQPTEKLINQLV